VLLRIGKLSAVTAVIEVEVEKLKIDPDRETLYSE
jgi:hypothetical protein